VGKRLAVVLVVTMMGSGSVLCASAQELRQVDPVVVTATKKRPSKRASRDRRARSHAR